MTDLRATIRLQFHKDFTLDDAVPLVDYFARLGISHVYASPLLTARPGSMHGYDVLDPTRINPELGGEPALERLVSELRKHNMGLILDIVSNHMAVGGSGNPWWLDVLEWGPMSPYAHFFDIQWQSLDPFMHDQLLVPFLRTDYGEVLSSGELKLHFDAEQGQFFAAHYDHRFPLFPPSYPGVLRASGNEALSTMAEKFQLLDHSAGAWSTARALRKELAEVVSRESLQGAIEQALSHYEPTEASGRKALHALLERQYYRLASWRTAADDINWRRFFDINELGGLRVELPDVFEATHAKVFELVENGSIDGLRIDHVDGLANPRAYCRRLRRRVDSLRGAQGSGHFPIYVEKIIGEGEALPTGWGVDGTTGYEFMNQVSLLQHDVGGREQLETLWNSLSGRPADFLEEVYEARKLVLAGSLAGDLESVAQGLLQIARFHIDTRDLTLGQIRRVLTELVAHFPVYRTYAGATGRSADDQRFFDMAKEGARRMLPEAEWPVLDQLDHWLGGEPLRRLPPGHERSLRNKVLVRFQQLTSPAAAKAVEDTACYRAGVLLSRYDVGFDPQHLGADAATFHEECQNRAQTFPDSMLTTATHDNKRGEDTRARLAVLSERAAWLAEKLQIWQGLAAPLRGELDGAPAPTPGDEAILYQSLLGSWSPTLDVDDADDADGIQAYLERLLGWQEKALREAKLISSWSSPNETYEQACRDFLTRLLTAAEGSELRREIALAVHSIAPAGALNGLVQTMLRLTVPGVPDLYQGCEFWDFNLVDPDNRRPVDFAARVAALQQTPAIDELLGTWRDGRIKQWLIHRILAIRAAQPQLFRHGAYVPLDVEGEHADRVVAFARRYEGDYLVTVVPRTVSTLLGDSPVPLVPTERWGDTRVRLPSPMQDNPLTCALSLNSINPVDGCIAVGKVLAEFPVNLLCSTPHCKESSV
ncbi:malto-oligosyltrehalose synthase [Halopseudomonas nanhaiensis]|uniref:malto-oligosyltrehalose synthase n=1 Tax=Halopseudomonas nanhaiensis TaxID=2830842 RepID=UPI001CBFC371|nr:malto-oligosyltrehalose synthase [Halopseudomonas nanhaiensis]UAW97741.1 malto-oligosyltrehalose synthase [Halopseudomonas nanhaiensis]